jgi:hypothetical protein
MHVLFGNIKKFYTFASAFENKATFFQDIENQDFKKEKKYLKKSLEC